MTSLLITLGGVVLVGLHALVFHRYLKAERWLRQWMEENR